MRMGEIVSKLAKDSGKSRQTIYRIAKKLGRLPTVEEARTNEKNNGRPPKYKFCEDI